MVQAVNTFEETKAPEGHDEAMAAKVDQVNEDLERQAGGDAPEEPQQKIAGKFDSVEDLEKAYKELEKKLGQPKEEPKEEAKEPTEDEAGAAVEKAGLNMEDMSSYYAEKGELSDEHYEALEKSGISRQYVDAYIEGLKAQQTLAHDNLMQQVGGQDRYNEITEWAKANLTEDEIAKYNRSIDSGDPEAMEMAVVGLSYRYAAENGRNPALVGGKTSGSGSSTFDSVAQLTEAMRDPRYSKDPAYRRDVEQRLARSNIL